MPRYETEYIADFNGGLNEVSPPSQIADNEVSDIMNMYYDPLGRSVIARYGTEEISLPGNPVASIYGFRMTGTTDTINLVGVNENPGKIYKMSSAGVLTDISGGAANNVIGMTWRTFNNVAIATCPISTIGPWYYTGSGNVALISALDANVPAGARWVEVWNNRVFFGGKWASRNTLYWSTLGDYSDWTTSGITGTGNLEVGYDDGDDITGIFAHAERLFIFKRHHIYQIVTANPNTDPTYWRLELVTKEGGCVSGTSIQAFNGDVIFLSEQGFASLNALIGGSTLEAISRDFERAIISKKLRVTANETRYNFPSAINPDPYQYWCAAETKTNQGAYGSSTGANTDVYVCDVAPSGEYRWTKYRFYQGTEYTGVNPLGWGYHWGPLKSQWFPISALGTVDFGGISYMLIGTIFQDIYRELTFGTTVYPLYLYPNRASSYAEKFSEGWSASNPNGKCYRTLKTKALHGNDPLRGKRYHTWGAGINTFVTGQDIKMNFTYMLDEDFSQIAGLENTASRQWFAGAKTGALNFTMDGNHLEHCQRYRIGAFGGAEDFQPGNRGRTLSMRLSNMEAKAGYAIKFMSLESAKTRHRHTLDALAQMADAPVISSHGSSIYSVYGSWEPAT